MTSYSKEFLKKKDITPFIPTPSDTTTSNSTSIANDIARAVVLKTKPELMIRKDYEEVKGITISIVKKDSLKDAVAKTEKTFSPMLINYVSPYTINKIDYCMFYTEVDSNFKVGDKVFILNGYYDNDIKISHYKYRAGRDGYNVLYIDKCKVVLDIKYRYAYAQHANKIYDTNVNYIDIFSVKTLFDLKSVIHDRVGYKDDTGSNVIPAYYDKVFYLDLSDKDYNNISVYFNQKGWDTLLPLDFLNNSFYCYDNALRKFVLLKDENTMYNRFNKSFRIVNADIIFNNNTYRKEFIYKYSSTDNKFITDVTYFRPYICKLNFRYGVFNGTWHEGLFGQNIKMASWDNNASVWHIGSLMNAIWEGGTISSDYTLDESNYTELGTDGVAHEKPNITNNNNRGYNYVINSIIRNANIINGSYYNDIICDTTNTNDIYGSYSVGLTPSYNCNVSKGYFNNTYINRSKIDNSEIKKCYINDSVVQSTNLNNSFSKRMVLENSNYNSDKVIKILDCDEYLYDGNIYNKNTTIYDSSKTVRLYKFYISEADFKRLRYGDVFYFDGIKITNDDNILNFFDKKYTIGTTFEYVDAVSISTITRYTYEYCALLTHSRYNRLNFIDRSTCDMNKNANMCSIDVWISSYDALKTPIKVPIPTQTKYNTSRLKTYSNIDVSNAYIIDSEYASGLMKNSNWNSGSHIENDNDNAVGVTISNNKASYSIKTTSANTIEATTLRDMIYEDMDIQKNDILYFDALDDIENNYKRINDTFVFNNITNVNNMTFYSLTASNLTQNDTYITHKALNRRYYFKKLKIMKCKILNGLFRRSYINGSLIQNLNIDATDMILSDMTTAKSLVLSDMLFSGDNNLLSNAVYNKSFFIDSTNWYNGIITDSVWDGGLFTNGVIRRSRWVDGDFKNGYFYDNKTFNKNATQYIKYYTSENIVSDYISDITLNVVYNNRHSWEGGTFSNGFFIRSDWEGGTFSDGRFYDSDFYNGYINGGIVGKDTHMATDTNVFGAVVVSTVVENANFYATNVNYVPTDFFIDWQNGVFNNGVFGCDKDNNGCATFSNGTFNGGQFITNAKWLNGVFNDGKFLSTYGYLIDAFYNVIDKPLMYAWENGTFNGGEFGNGSITDNSSWLNGTFNGGVFKGRNWYGGLFRNGLFYGSGITASGTYTSATYSSNYYADDFTKDYRDGKYYGYWHGGRVDGIMISNSLISDTYKVNMYNILWGGGVFFHQNGLMKNCIWLDGIFGDGTFKDSSFNPYVIRDDSINHSFNMSYSCVWEDGRLFNSDFYISHWKKGIFDKGNGYGMIWEDGTCKYMNANNIYWNGGIWKNGNWNGAMYDWDGATPSKDVMSYKIMENVATYSNGNFIWNVFLNNENVKSTFDDSFAAASECNTHIQLNEIIGGKGTYSKTFLPNINPISF